MSGARGVSVTVDLAGMERRLGEGSLRAAQAALGRRVMQDSNYFVMWDTGATFRSAAVSSAGDEVTWNTPYARAAYEFAGTPRRVHNANAQTRWFEHAKSAYSQAWADFVRGLL